MSTDPKTLARRWRRELHQNPGTGFDVDETADFIARVCSDLGWDVTTGIGGTGLVATLRRGTSPQSIGLRADMDGLPIEENTGAEYRSRNHGAMHACGHDGHMAMLLGTASALATGGEFDGTVRLFFQPAEEPGTGAEAMLADGLLELFPVDAVYGLHNIPGLPEGELHVRSGAIMAAEDNFEIRISGRGGHASAPHLVIDPMVVGAEVILAVQSIVSRDIDPLDSVVVSCTEFVSDGARNAIPTQVVIRGDARSFSDAASAMVETRVREIAQGVGSAHGATCSVSYTREFRPTINDETCVNRVIAAATAAIGRDNVRGDCRPVMASEDFAAYLRAVPGCFAFLGAGDVTESGTSPLHSHTFDFNDNILGAGIDVYLELVRAHLTKGPGA